MFSVVFQHEYSEEQPTPITKRFTLAEAAEEVLLKAFTHAAIVGDTLCISEGDVSASY